MARKVVILDDDQKVVLLVEKILTQLGFFVYTACDGEKALEMALEVKPDLLIADILVPGMDGIQICKIIKSDPQTAHTKVILITGIYKESSLRKELECGADGLIEKPVDSKRLKNLVLEKVSDLF